MPLDSAAKHERQPNYAQHIDYIGIPTVSYLCDNHGFQEEAPLR